MVKTCKECKHWSVDCVPEATWRICTHDKILEEVGIEGKAINPDWIVPDWCPLADKEEENA